MNKLLRQLSIRHRFIATAALIAALTIAWLGGTNLARQHEAQTLDTAMATTTEAAAQVNGLLTHLALLRQHELGMMVNANNTNEVDRIRQAWMQERQALERGLQAIGSDARVPAGSAEHVAKGLEALKGYVEILAPVVEQLAGATMDASVAHAYASKADPQTVNRLLREKLD